MKRIIIPTEFRWRLAEAEVWCSEYSSVSDPTNSLRTPALQPYQINLEGDYIRYDWLGNYGSQPVVDILARKRSNILNIKGKYPKALSNNLLGGKLLVYFPYDTLADGAAEEVSQGFFDVNNVPPWDTWLYFLSEEGTVQGYTGQTHQARYLVSWVPHALIELVSNGVLVNPEGCICWAEDLDIMVYP